MNRNIDSHIISGIVELSSEDRHAKALFKYLASRSRDASETTIYKISEWLEIDYYEAVGLARSLHNIDCGRLVLGRKGHSSRFVWNYSLKSLGLAAQGNIKELQRVDPDAVDDEAGNDATVETPVARQTSEIATPKTNLTIPEAKRLLGITLGVPPEAIEIIVRA